MKTTEQFIEEAKLVHGNKYDYSSIQYKGCGEKIIVSCKKHNITFNILARNFLIGHTSCKECIAELKRKQFAKTTEQFIEEAKLIHGDKYNYDLVEYKNNSTKVKIFCNNCKEYFYQTPAKHIDRKHGCDKCGGTANLTLEEFIKRSNLIFNNKYDYSKTKFKTTSDSVIIICPAHGEFKQLINNHLSGHGCKYCKQRSKGEEFIKNFLEKKNISFIHNHTFHDLKDKNNLSYDFYLPDYNLLIEFNGKQHYKAIKYYGGIKKFYLQKHHDWLKRKYSRKHNFKLLVIPYWEYKNLNKILEKYIV